MFRKKERWIPEPPSIAVTLSIKALAEGNANPDQQRRALKWIIEDLCKTYDFPYGQTDRETCLLLGMQLVGKQLVKEININPSLLKRKDNG